MPIMLAPPGSVDPSSIGSDGQDSELDEVVGCIDLELSKDQVDVQKLRDHFDLLKKLIVGAPTDSTCCGDATVTSEPVMTEF